MKQFFPYTKLGMLIILSICIFNISTVKAQFKGDSFSSAKSSKKASITCPFVTTPGFIEKDATGKMKGLLVDVMSEFKKYVKEKKGITLTTNYALIPKDDFKALLDKVKTSNGGVFGLSNITITEERKKYYKFSPPYISNISVVVSNKKVPSLSSLSKISKEFEGKTAYIIKGGTLDNRMKKIKKTYYPTMKIAYLPSELDILNKISKDENAFSIIDFVFYLSALQNKQPVKRHAVGDSKSEKFGIMMPKSNDWAPLMEEFFSGGFISGTQYRKIISKNLGTNALQLLDGLANK